VHHNNLIEYGWVEEGKSLAADIFDKYNFSLTKKRKKNQSKI
jgi:hypothetical protein